MRKQFERGKQAGRNQEWLGNRGVSDGFGVGFGAVMPQIEARHCRQPVEPVSESGYIKPRAEEPWCLRPLTRRHNRKHICTISWPRRKGRTGTRTNIRTSYCHFPTVFLVLLLAHRALESDVVVALREQKARSLIAPPIVGRAICRRSQHAAQPGQDARDPASIVRRPAGVTSAQARDSSGRERAKSRPKVIASRSAYASRGSVGL